MEFNSVCDHTSYNKSESGVRFVHHQYDYRLNWTTLSLITNHKNYNFREKSVDFWRKHLNHRINKISTVFQNIVIVQGKKISPFWKIAAI